ncbi:MAG: PorV/PorQ family protein [Candidatus Eisenbacteria bacterium]|nr:PorV/PorQ family protein [Candidatus Eisenbacteria bacterium]
MAKMVISLLFLVFFIFSSQSCPGQTSAGAISLQIAPNARADGMGRSFGAIADDASAVWWNPAGMAFLKGTNGSLTHIALVPDLVSDVYYEFLSATTSLGEWGAVGTSLAYLTYGKNVATGPGGPEDVIGTFSPFEFAPSIAFASKLSSVLGIGVNLKFVRVDLAPAWALQAGMGKRGAGTTVAVDLGALTRLRSGKLCLGASFQNLGPNIAYVDEDQSDPLGRNLKVGAAYVLGFGPASKLLFTFDFNKPFVYVDDPPIFNYGAEFNWNDFLALRAGYIDEGLTGSTVVGPTFGIGIMYGRLRFDYANVTQSKFLERASRYSLTAKF